MKFTVVLLVILGMITNITTKTGESKQTGTSIPANLPRGLESSILAATFQIQVYNGEETHYEQGLATLVKVHEQVFLVSHNHWKFLANSSKAIVLDAKSNPLMVLNHEILKSLIVYNSRGTLVLQAPEGLGGTPAETGTVENILPGNPALLVHQGSSESDGLEVVAGEIQEFSNFHQNPALYLFLPGKDTIRQGDSGGGIWINGKLVGNLWAYHYELKAGRYFLDLVQEPIAAVIPLEAINMITDPADMGSRPIDGIERPEKDEE